MDVVGEVIEIEQAGTDRLGIACPQPLELGIVSRALGAVAIDEIEQAAADALDRGHIKRLLHRRHIGRFGAERDRTVIGRLRIDHAKRHRRRAGAVRGDEVEAVGAGLLVDEIVDVALAVDRDLLALVAGDGRITHQLEQRVQLFRIGMRIFDELEPVGAHRIVGGDGGRRCIVRKRTHGALQLLLP
ncbi:hypothetical protein ACVWZ3_009147 [Bradyrhizobium sp. i1.3.6]